MKETMEVMKDCVPLCTHEVSLAWNDNSAPSRENLPLLNPYFSNQHHHLPSSQSRDLDINLRSLLSLFPISKFTQLCVSLLHLLKFRFWETFPDRFCQVVTLTDKDPALGFPLLLKPAFFNMVHLPASPSPHCRDYSMHSLISKFLHFLLHGIYLFYPSSLNRFKEYLEISAWASPLLEDFPENHPLRCGQVALLCVPITPVY